MPRNIKISILFLCAYAAVIGGFACVYCYCIPDDFHFPYYEKEYVKKLQDGGHLKLLTNRAFEMVSARMDELEGKQFLGITISGYEYAHRHTLNLTINRTGSATPATLAFDKPVPSEENFLLPYSLTEQGGTTRINGNFAIPASLYELLSDRHNIGFEERGTLKNFQRALYFSIATITTLGYGDIIPVTDTARRLAGLETILGIITIGLFLGFLTTGRE